MISEENNGSRQIIIIMFRTASIIIILSSFVSTDVIASGDSYPPPPYPVSLVYSPIRISVRVPLCVRDGKPALNSSKFIALEKIECPFQERRYSS